METYIVRVNGEEFEVEIERADGSAAPAAPAKAAAAPAPKKAKRGAKTDEEKKAAVWKDHGDQLLGQFISNSAVEEIWVVKYIYQDDDILKDTDSPLAPWRGLVFKFARKDFEASIEEMKRRIILFDKMIDAPINPAEFKKGEWCVDDNGQLLKK